MKTFREWLLEQKDKDTIVGDLANDFSRAPGNLLPSTPAVNEALLEALHEYDYYQRTL